MVLQYWNTDTGEVSEVLLGPLPGCGISPVVSDKLVELGSWSPNYHNVMSDGPVRYVVPWGDEAYPVLNVPGYGDDIPVTAGRPVVNQTVFDGRLEASYVGELLDGAFVLRVATPQQEAYYNPGYDPSSGTGSGYWSMFDEVPLRGVHTEDSYDEGPWVAAVGTDGFHFSLSLPENARERISGN